MAVNPGFPAGQGARPDWLALSDSVPFGTVPPLMERGLFVVEFSLPLDRATLLLSHEADAGWPRALSLLADPEAGLTLTHQQGPTTARHHLPGALRALRGVARVGFTFDAPARLWRMTLEIMGLPGHNRSAHGTAPLPFVTADLQALAMAPRHPHLLWLGATSARTLPARAPWIGLRTLVETDRGPVEAVRLRPGDRILTLDDGPMPLRRVIRRRLPSRGSFAPIVLRSPFFGLQGDILVSADQLVLISGASVEYLWGAEEVLVPASALCDGKVAEREDRRAVTDTLALDLGRPALIVADGSCLLSACGEEAQMPRRTLASWETPPLVSLLGRTALRRVA